MHEPERVDVLNCTEHLHKEAMHLLTQTQQFNVCQIVWNPVQERALPEVVHHIVVVANQLHLNVQIELAGRA